MKRIFIVLAIVFAASCKEGPKAETAESDMVSEQMDASDTESSEMNYPEDLTMVFEAHGGLDTWKKKRNLSFTIPSPDAAEVNNVDLYSRKGKIEMPTASMGFDGENVWLMDEAKTYEGNPAVYHNLMFYFYAMPFVFADEGVNYGETEPLQFEGKSYPGIHMTFDDGVGASPKDDYYLYYDADTHQMAWLGYTFTYGSDERSENVSYIRYTDWADVDGVVLPTNLTWYNSEGTMIKDAKDPLPFEDVKLSEDAKPEEFYAMPEGATEVE